jgi:hypothetical protein
MPDFATEKKMLVSEMKIIREDSVLKYSYIYDTKGLLVSEIRWLNVHAEWKKQTQKEWFRTEGLPASQTYRVWSTDKWVDNFKIRYLPIENGYSETHFAVSSLTETPVRKIERIKPDEKTLVQKQYVYVDNQYIICNVNTSYFSGSLQPDSTLTEILYPAEKAAVYKTNFIYNSDFTTRSVELVRLLQSGKWQRESLSVYTYKPTSKNPSSLQNYSWNQKISKWENLTRIDYSYSDAGVLMQETYWLWLNYHWERNMRYGYSYNEKSFAEKRILNPIYQDWRNTGSVVYQPANNDESLDIKSIYGFWGTKKGDLRSDFIMVPFNDEVLSVYGQQIQLTYVPFFDTSVTKPEISGGFRVYPNPSNGVYYINHPSTEKVDWKIMSVSGNVLRSSAENSQTFLVDITDFPAGMYFLCLNSVSGNVTQRILKF